MGVCSWPGKGDQAILNAEEEIGLRPLMHMPHLLYLPPGAVTQNPLYVLLKCQSDVLIRCGTDAPEWHLCGVTRQQAACLHHGPAHNSPPGTTAHRCWPSVALTATEAVCCPSGLPGGDLILDRTSKLVTGCFMGLCALSSMSQMSF